MKYTLLEMVQRILESMESDEVNTISETPESQAVANIIKETYYDLIGQLDPPEVNGIFRLDSSNDNTKPVLMTIPSNVATFDWIKYNKETLEDPRFAPLGAVSNEEFLALTFGYDSSVDNVGTMTTQIKGIDMVFKYYTDRFPQFYTVFDTTKVIFNAYDSEVENTLTQIRSLGQGLIVPTFTMSDSFIPELDHRQFQLLINEAKSVSFVELKQTTNAKSEQKARRNFIKAQKDRNTDASNGSNRQPTYKYGRR